MYLSIKAKVSVTGIKFTSIRNHCFPLILSNVSGVILSDESHEIVDNVYYSTADLQDLETGAIDPVLWNTTLDEKDETSLFSPKKFRQELTILNLATLNKSEKVQSMFYIHAFSFLAVVTHDNWKLGTFPYPRFGIVPTLYIEGVKSFSISPIQFIMQRCTSCHMCAVRKSQRRWKQTLSQNIGIHHR